MLANRLVGGRFTLGLARYAATADAWYDGRANTVEKPPPVVMTPPVAELHATSVESDSGPWVAPTAVTWAAVAG